MTPPIPDDDLTELRALLRGELAAVETYAQAIELVREEPLLRTTLQQCQVSHQRRCSRLEAEIRRHGAAPTRSSGVWGNIAKLVEAGAQLFGVHAAIIALEEGERHGLRMYQDAITDQGLSAQIRGLVACDLLQEQRATRQRLSLLAVMLDRNLNRNILKTRSRPKTRSRAAARKTNS